MKMTKRILAAMLIVVLMFSLVACGKNGIEGEWVAVDGADEGVIWNFKSNGDIYLYEDDGEEEALFATYEIDGDEITIIQEDGGDEYKGTFEIDGDELTIDIDGDVAVFERK